MRLGTREVGTGRKPYIIAECCHNHMGIPELARAMVRSAAACGADAVKFQHRGRVPLDFLLMCRIEALDCGVDFLCTAYTPEAVAEIDPFVLAHKIGSAEGNDPDFVKHVASFGKPVILSTGAMSYNDIVEALQHLSDVEYARVFRLQCTSIYPCPPQFVRLGVLADQHDSFFGYSDHTGDVTAPIMAMALGAGIVEVHFTLSRELPTIDRAVSHAPEDLFRISRAAEQRNLLLEGGKEFFAQEREKIEKFRKGRP